MADQHAPQDDLTGEVRLRLPLPIVIPVGSLLLIGLVAFGFSRIFLNVPKEAALVIASVLAANILGGFAVLATRRRVARTTLLELLIVVSYPLVIGAVIASMGIEDDHSAGEPAHAAAAEGESESEGGGEGGGGATTTVTAQNTQFDTDTITLTAGPNTLTFENLDDGVPHNISVYEDDTAEKTIFEGETIDGGSVDYEIEMPAKPPEAFFRCDVHPDMQGTVEVAKA
jgi:plastocyanin